jgi:glutathione synthase/RimK-type ligase-like ATP-grasp enzyme
MTSRRVHGKLLKGNAMYKSFILRRHLPRTYPYNPVTLKRMMTRHPDVFIKPDKSSQGEGIVRLKRLNRDIILISWKLNHRKIRRNKVGRALKKLLQPRRTYLVQQGLKLAKYNNRLVDIRVYMQKPKSTWFVSGKVVRVAAPGRFVTNYSQGATPETVQKVLFSIYKKHPRQANHIIRRIDRLSIIAAKVLDRRFPGIRQLGIDIAVDSNGRIWIIEANTTPGFKTFKHLRDKSMYRRIVLRRNYILKH